MPVAKARKKRGGGVKHPLFELKDGAFKFALYQPDHVPPHVHIEARDDSSLIVEIETGEIILNSGFSKGEASYICKYVVRRKIWIMQRWHEIHGKRNDHES